MRKWSFLDRNHWLTPFWQNVNFSTLWTFCFYSLERRFFALEYRKTHFPGLYCIKKKLEKWPFFYQNHWVTPVEKCQFFDFLNFLFFSLERYCFVLEFRQRHFPLPILPKKKKLDKRPFLHQNHGLTSLEKCQFLNFWTSRF